MLGLVILEEGSSYQDEDRFRGLRGLLGKLGRAAKACVLRPSSALSRVQAFVFHKEYFGRKDFHDRRILGTDFDDLSPGIPTLRVSNVNSADTLDALREYDPHLVFVFGTGIVKPAIFEAFKAPFVNLHWGWSPEYRGEGIVTALALGGPAAVGVTVHLLSAGIDSGDILARSRPILDADDNFYAIGLKLTVLGTQLFIDCAERFRATGALQGAKQDRSSGAFRGTAFMRQHPEMYQLAWKRLKRLASPSK